LIDSVQAGMLRGKKKTIRGWLEWKNVAASCCRLDTDF